MGLEKFIEYVYEEFPMMKEVGFDYDVDYCYSNFEDSKLSKGFYFVGDVGGITILYDEDSIRKLVGKLK